MSNIDFTKALTPETICYNNLKFRIPLYQRPYAWEEKQVKQLLKDLYESRKKENSELYYVGILSVAKTFEDEMLFDLIDGQQRFTTLMLIGKAAGDIDHTMDWSKFLKLDGELGAWNCMEEVMMRSSSMTKTMTKNRFVINA